ncbi:hypothetical protein HS125_07800 [bacterium]|nr:hypothetical protein [bacterium]
MLLCVLTLLPFDMLYAQPSERLQKIESLRHCSGGQSAIFNNIFWNNKYQGSTSHAYSNLYQSSTPAYSCIQNWTGGGTGNITSDPDLIDPTNGDFHLGTDSPCINVGLTFQGYFYKDMDGHYRGNTVVYGYYTAGPQTNGYLNTGYEADIGADEYAWLE